MANFWPKPWTNPFGKVAIFDFFNCFFYSLETRFFVLEYRKTHFSGLYFLKKKMKKWPIFDKNHGKMALEKWLFELLVFIAWKGLFAFYNIVKHIFLSYIALRKNL